MDIFQKAIKLCAIGFLTVVIAACTTSEGYAPDAVVSKKQKSADINVRLGMDYLQNENLPMAKASLLSALKSAPRSPSAWYTMAYYMELTGELKKAQQYYQHAVKLAPHSGIAQNNYGTFLCRHGKYRAAIQQFIGAANQPNYINVSSAYENAGLCALLVPDNVAATTYFQKALQNDPDHPTSLIELAKISYGQGNLQQAKAYYARYRMIGKPTKLSAQVARLLSQT